MTESPATFVVALTATGRGALASLVVAGAAATQMVGKLFHHAGGKPLADQPLDRILYGRWELPTSGEEVVVCRRDRLTVEVHCHGGMAARRAIIDSLSAQGCTPLDWRDWVRQTERDEIAADARIALASAPTQRTARVLLDQYRGALRQAVDEMLANVHAGDISAARTMVDRLLSFASLGQHLVTPWNVVVAGAPNAGKSSLINALLGFRRMIVHTEPGTTRDVVSTATAIDGWPVELIDTAGLRDSDDPLEAAGVALAKQQMAQADLLLLVRDSSLPWGPAEEAAARDWPLALWIHNKVDLVASEELNAITAGVFASATTGQGLAEVVRAIADRLVPATPCAGQPVPFTAMQAESLCNVREALAEGDIARAEQRLRASPWRVRTAC